MVVYYKLILVAVIQIIVGVGCYLLDKKTKFGKINFVVKTIIFGLIFGGLSVLGSEMGTTINGATLNLRDAAPIFAGLAFGPAGIIAGIIGGVERYFAVLWGAGAFTQIACSISTALIGFFAALIRKVMFENKLPSISYGFAIGIVAEIIHMLMVFLTNFKDVHKAFIVVQDCVLPMTLLTGFILMVQLFVISVINVREIFKRRHNLKKIQQSFQRWLLACITVAFICTSLFTWKVQNRLVENSTNETLKIALDDIEEAVQAASDSNLLNMTHKVANSAEKSMDIMSNELLSKLATEFDVSEVNFVNNKGYVEYSSREASVGYNMRSHAQSVEFIKLLGSTKEFVQKYQSTGQDNGVYRKYAGVKFNDGFIQVGYDTAHVQSDIDFQVKSLSANRHVGTSGKIIVVDANGIIISGGFSGYIGENISSLGYDVDTSNIIPKVSYSTTILNEEYACMYSSSEGYYVIVCIPKSEMVLSRDLSVYLTVFMEILVFAGLFILVYFLIKKLIVENIQKVNCSLAEITGGNLDVVVDVRNNEEFASLSNDINATVETLKRYIDEAAARIDRELEFAKTIQYSVLPNSDIFIYNPKFDIYAFMATAKEVGGDFYDFYLIDEKHLAFLIADVSGKGIPAAMFMMQAKSIIKNLAENKLPIADVFTEANEQLCDGNDAGMFVTAWMGIIDIETGVVKCANAGHNPPVIYRKNGQFEFLHSRPGFVLAGMEHIKYKETEFYLEPGDKIFLYTDGVTEATTQNDELFGDDRLIESLNNLAECSPQDICNGVKKDVDKFVGDADQFDDITMVCLEFFGDATD